jgi:hypothetical protein
MGRLGIEELVGEVDAGAVVTEDDAGRPLKVECLHDGPAGGVDDGQDVAKVVDDVHPAGVGTDRHIGRTSVGPGNLEVGE